MGGVLDEDRKALEAMREAIISRMEELDAQESYGNLSVEQKHQALVSGFGPEYQSILRDINSVLHTKKSKPHIPHSAAAIFLVAGLAMVTIIAALIYPGVITGAVIIGEQEISINQELSHNGRVRVPMQVPIIISDIALEKQGGGEYTLQLTSRDSTATLVKGTDTQYECELCGQQLYPPYMIEAYTQGGAIDVQSITIIA